MFSLHLKLPNLSVFWGDGPEGGGRVVLFYHFARPPSYFSLATGLTEQNSTKTKNMLIFMG